MSDTGHADLLVPGDVPVTQLLPDLARRCGGLDRAAAFAGHRIVTQEGRHLDHDQGLLAQGVRDGALLILTSRVDEQPPRRYDDLAEALADALESHRTDRPPGCADLVGCVVAGLVLLLAAAALVSARGAPAAPGVAAGLAAALLVAALVLSRAARLRPAAAVAAGAAATFAACFGIVAVPTGPLLGLPVATAGGSAALVGLVLLAAPDRDPTVAIPPIVVGGTSTAAGLAMHVASVPPNTVLAGVLTLVVASSIGFPRLALALGVTRTGRSGAAACRLDDDDGAQIDPTRLAEDARLAHRIAVGLSAAAGVMLAALGPVVAAGSLQDGLLAVDCCLVVLLGSRRYRDRVLAAPGLVSGIAALIGTVAALLVRYPSSRVPSAATLTATAGLLLAGRAARWGRSARLAWLGDLVEGAALLALGPLLVLSVGLLDAVRR